MAVPLKIALATPQLPSVSETFVSSHIEMLDRVELVLHGGIPAREVLLRTAPSSQSRLVTTGKLGRVLRRIVGRRAAQAYEFEIAMLLRSARIDVVLAEFAPVGEVLARACARAGVPLVTHLHGADVFVAQKDAYPLLGRFGAGFVYGTEEMKLRACELGFPETLLRRVPCGVSPRVASGSESIFRRFDRESTFGLIAVGRFVEKKAPHLLMLAFAAAQKKVPRLRLTMIGDGPLLDATKMLARALGVGNFVDFLGARPHAEVGARLDAADCFVQHSVHAPNGDAEGTAISVLEASVRGLPVIASRHGGIAESMIDGKTALLVDEFDVEAMATSMVHLAMHPDLARELGVAGQRRVLERYSQEDALTALQQTLSLAVADRKNP